MYHLGPQLGVWIMQVSTFSSVLINRFHCIYIVLELLQQLGSCRVTTTYHSHEYVSLIQWSSPLVGWIRFAYLTILLEYLNYRFCCDNRAIDIIPASALMCVYVLGICNTYISIRQYIDTLIECAS